MDKDPIILSLSLLWDYAQFLFSIQEKIQDRTRLVALAPSSRWAMGKLVPVLLLSLHVAQTASFAPCTPTAFAHVTSARRPLLTTCFHARPHEHGGARHLRATLSRDAAQVRAVVEPMSTSLVSLVLSRGMAALHCKIHVLIHQFIMLASLVFASLPAAVLSVLLVFAAAPSLAFADQVASPRVHFEEMVATTVADAAGSGSEAMKIVTIASAGSLALHTLLTYRIFEAHTRRPDF